MRSSDNVLASMVSSAFGIVLVAAGAVGCLTHGGAGGDADSGRPTEEDTACAAGCDSNGETGGSDSAPDSAADSGSAGDTADTGGGTVVEEFDECADFRGTTATEARLLEEEYYGTAPTDGIVVLATPEDLDSWWAEMGYAGPVPTIDFATEQAVAFVAVYSQGCGEGERLNGFSWAADGSYLLAEIGVSQPCEGGCDDAILFGRLWATPVAAVAACLSGSRCE